MCFSAAASITSGTGLLIIGSVAISQSQNVPQRLLAGIPVFFAVQQFSEGLLWLSLSSVDYWQWQQVSMYSFLVFANILWPSIIPVAVLLLEKNEQRKKVLRILLAIGVFTSQFAVVFQKPNNSLGVVSDYVRLAANLLIGELLFDAYGSVINNLC